MKLVGFRLDNPHMHNETWRIFVGSTTETNGMVPLSSPDTPPEGEDIKAVPTSRELLQYLEETTWEHAAGESLREIQSMVDHVKHNREVSVAYMKWYEREQMYRNEGKAEGISEGKIEECVTSIKDFLADLGTIPENITAQIDGTTDLDTLRRWLKLAAKSDSIEEFVQKM